MSQFCPQCQEQIPSAAKYCMYCGVDVSLKVKNNRQRVIGSKKNKEHPEKISELIRTQSELKKEISKQKIKNNDLELELKIASQELEKYKEEIKNKEKGKKDESEETDNIKIPLIILSILLMIIVVFIVIKLVI